MEKILDQSWHLLSCWVSHLRNLPQTLICQVRENNFLRIQFRVIPGFPMHCFWSRTVVLVRIPLCDRTDTTYFTILALTSETRKSLLERCDSGGRHVTLINSAWGRVAKWLVKWGESFIPCHSFKIVNLFIIFHSPGSSLASGLCSSCSEQEVLSSYNAGFS